LTPKGDGPECLFYAAELHNRAGAWLHFIDKHKGKGKLCEESAALKDNRQMHSDTAIGKLENGQGKLLTTKWEWEGWKLINCSPQIALYRPIHSSPVPLSELVHYVDSRFGIHISNTVKVSPMLVLDTEGFSFIGIKGHGISVQQGRLLKHGLISQVALLCILSVTIWICRNIIVCSFHELLCLL
jgi:hypothetical protein